MLRADVIFRFFVRSIGVTVNHGMSLHKSHNVLGIALVAIIDRQLHFVYTITSRSTDVVVMALPVQNINHSAFRSMFEREKLSVNNFNDWFRQLKLVLRVEKKMYVIEQPLPAAHAANSEANVLLEWNALYDAYNEVACLILGSMNPELHRQFENSSPYDMIKELKAMFEKQARVERFDLIQTFHACKQEEGKPVAAYVIQIKGYVDQLERLGYMLPQDLVVGLILNGLTKDFVGFGLSKKAETPQVMMIKGGKIQKANKKLLKAKGKGKANGKRKDKLVYIPKPKNPKSSAKEHPAKDDACHHCKEVGYWKRNCPVYLAELLKKKKQVGPASSSEGVDVGETFSAVVKQGTIRTALSLAASRHWPIHQLDVKNAFLHGDLSETVYMHEPLGFWDSVNPDYVCLLQRLETDTAYLLLYVDDIVLTASSKSLLQQIIRSLHKKFAMTDLGSLNYFLGVAVTRDSSESCGFSIVSLLPDISYAVQQLFSSSTIDLFVYSDADWAGFPTTRRSTSGYCVFLGNNLLFWSSKRQPTLSRSSAETDYHGVANVVAETCWIRNLLRELYSLLSSATLVYCDNISAVYLSCNPVQHQRTKHIKIGIHFVRDLVAAG
ncbi:ribonuclease H-like domain-containing protein [Tanacetum coccineum]